MKTINRLRPFIASLAALLAIQLSQARDIWLSDLRGEELELRIEVEGSQHARETAIILKNVPGVAVDPNLAKRAKAQLAALGFRIITIDYESREIASFPAICYDIGKLRSDIFKGTFLSELIVDQNRVFILPEGYVVECDVSFFDDEKRSLRMDLCHSLEIDEGAKQPIVMEFSCDNEERMGNFSLVACRDTLLEGLSFSGYATAMADHPVAAPYKGIDPMPDCGYKVKAAVRRLRALGREKGLSDRIGVVGFSRGSGMALLLAATNGKNVFGGEGYLQTEDEAIQGAVILSGRFTYIDLLEDDPMLRRYERVWGSLSSSSEIWKEHGALDYLEQATVPMYLSMNSGESNDAQYQMKVLRERLDSLGSEYVYFEDSDSSGHKVPVNGLILKSMQSFLSDQLKFETKMPSTN